MPPTALIDALKGVRRRVRRLSVLYGTGLVIAAAAGLLLATVLLDYLLNLPPVPRLVVMAAAVVALTWLLARRVIQPAAAKLGLSDLAGRLENAFPQFDDRLRSTVDFLTGKKSPGSDLMKTRVAAEAAEMAAHVNLSSAVRTKPVWHSLGGAAASVAVLAMLAGMAGSEYLGPAISRLLTPFHGMPWPKRVHINEVGNLPARVPVGSRVDVRIRLTKGDSLSRQATVFYQYGEGPVEKELMNRGTDGVYSASLDARSDSGSAQIAASLGDMKIWTESGDDATDPRSIALLPPLSLTKVELSVTPPAYTGEPVVKIPMDATPVTVTFGSSLSLQLTFNRDLDASVPVKLLASDGEPHVPAVAWDKTAGSVAAGHWVARESASFSVRAVDGDGFSNGEGSEYQVIVRPDLSPDVQITRPARNEECTPEAVVPLQAVAEDDYQIKSLKLIATKLGEPLKPLSVIDLMVDGKAAPGVTLKQLDPAGDRRRWQVDYPWDLARADSKPLANGDVLEYHLEAQDNFDFEGQTHAPVQSGSYRITMIGQEQFTQLMQDLISAARDQVVALRDSQRGLKDETADLAKETQDHPQFSNADRQEAADLIARQTTVAAETRQVSQKLDDLVARMDENKSTAADLHQVAASARDDLAHAAEQPMKQAAGDLGDARDGKPPEERNSELADAGTQQQTSADTLDQVANRMGDSGGLPKAIEQLKNLLTDQKNLEKKSDDVGMKNLGKQPNQLSHEDQKTEQDISNDQSKLGDQTDKAIAQLQSDSQKLQKSDPDSSDAMKQAASTGQQQGVSSQMKSAASAQQQNQQSSVQQSQSQAEIGLQTMLRQLEEAEQRKLEELSRKLADMRDQVKALVREQAGLNYDNLSLQAGDVLKKTDAKIVAAMIADAERDKDHLPAAPDLGTQTRLQEQTERNSRSIAKTAEPLPSGSEIAAAINRAADRMGRAITYLRDDQQPQAAALASAYDPQTQALDSLRQALNVVQQELQKANDKINQAQKDTLRAAYQKILDAQKVIDADTKTIDKAPHGADGSLGHADAVHLAQLPGQQSGLADQTAQLTDTLSSIGGVVYTWANNDIIDSMNGVKTLLQKPKTDTTTQAEQTRIEQQLQAMIDNLKTDPKKSDAPPQQQAGGGGGGGTPPMPPEAELRLLKQLQEAVNQSTTTISKQASPADPTLVALGDRQGQLRNVLDQLLQKASQGKMSLGPEPGPNNKLPEEGDPNKVDQNDLAQSLLDDNGQPDPTHVKNDVDEVGKRMSRVKQRLAADHDPGQTTQTIEKNIVDNLDALIEMSRAQESQSQQQQASGQQPQQAQPPGQQPGQQQQPSSGQNQANAGHSPAQSSNGSRSGDGSGTPQTDITQTQKEWGNLPPRERQKVIEAESEKPIEKFRDFIDKYYKTLGQTPANQ